jgi:protein-L-isoaspartate(D-aspartate) O-methyltransferase
MIDLSVRRRLFAEEIEAVCNLRSARLVDAFAAVPRERFLPDGPWTVRGEGGDGTMLGGPPRSRTTVDADPARVYHNIAVAIDPARQLFNGQPATLAVWLDALALTPGARVLHVGCGLGYYTAVMAEAVGPSGHVVAYEVDEPLADRARQNLSTLQWVEVRHGDGSAPSDETFDAILVNAGVTHPLAAWLDALAPGGRMLLPLTGTMPAMAPTIGKGIAWLLTRQDDGSCAARVVGVVAIYSAIGVRDDAVNPRLGKALMGGPQQWAAVKRLRRDRHDADAACWLHGDGWCWSSLRG